MEELYQLGGAQAGLVDTRGEEKQLQSNLHRHRGLLAIVCLVLPPFTLQDTYLAHWKLVHVICVACNS
jgi:hypothetical protein